MTESEIYILDEEKIMTECEIHNHEEKNGLNKINSNDSEKPDNDVINTNAINNNSNNLRLTNDFSDYLYENNFNIKDDLILEDDIKLESKNVSSKKDIEIIVNEPSKIGEGMNAYITYRVSTKTNLQNFKCQEMCVTRRFSDFLSLHLKLVASHQYLGYVIPPPPQKDLLGTTMIKISKEEMGSIEFLERRRAALERFLLRIGNHPYLRKDPFFIEFLELDEELPKFLTTPIGSFFSFFGRMSESFNRLAFVVEEVDPFFEDRAEQIAMMEHELSDLRASIQCLVLNRKELTMNMKVLARSVDEVGSCEEDMALSSLVSKLSGVFAEVDAIQADQADQDFYLLSEHIYDCLQILEAIKEANEERQKQLRLWKDTENLLAKKKQAKTKFDELNKLDKSQQLIPEIDQLEEKVAELKEKFDSFSSTLKCEVEAIDAQRVADLKSAATAYLQRMIHNQQHAARAWQTFIQYIKS